MKREKRNSVIFAVIGIVLALLIVSPLLYCVFASFMTEKELYASQLLPSSLNLDNYVSALQVAVLLALTSSKSAKVTLLMRTEEASTLKISFK